MFYGMYPAVVTPFDHKNQFDAGALHTILQVCLERGARGFFVNGTTGEFFLQSMEERKQVLEASVRSVADKGQIIAHVGAANLQDTIQLAQHAQSVGAAGVASIAPLYFTFSFAEVMDFFRQLAQSVTIPVYLYNIPANANRVFTEEQLLQLLSIDNIVGLKHTSNEVIPIGTLAASGANVLCGNENMLLAALTLGATGSVGSSFNCITEKAVALQASFERGDLEEGRRLQQQIQTVCAGLAQAGTIASIKTALQIMGLPAGAARAPFKMPDAGQRAQLEQLVRTCMKPVE